MTVMQQIRVQVGLTILPFDVNVPFIAEADYGVGDDLIEVKIE